MSVPMKNPAGKQEGKSAIGNLLVFALIGFGIWVGIQYIPQRIEAATVRSVLDRVEKRHAATPIRDDRDLWAIVNKQLNVNEMQDMRPNFKSSWNRSAVTVTVDYTRELNLIFTTKTIEYRERLVLN